MADEFYDSTSNASDPEAVFGGDTAGSSRGGAMAATAVGGAASAYAQYRSGKTNQALARFNANQMRMRAEQTIQAGNFAANRRAMVAGIISGRTIAGQGASGTVVGAGTNRLAVTNQNNASAMDQYLIKLNASRVAGSELIGAAGEDLRGDMAKQEGEARAFGSLLNTGNDLWLESDPRFAARFGRGVAVGGG